MISHAANKPLGWSRWGLAALLCAAACLSLPAGAQTTVTNTASVAAPANGVDPTPGNNSASDTDTVLAPQLTLSKSHTGNFTVGANGTYTLTVSNTSTAADGAPTSGTIAIVDTLPNGLSFVSAAGAGWSCSASGQTVTCTSTTAIPVGGSSTATLTVAVGNAAVGSVTNTARASGGNDPGCPAAPGTPAARCSASDPTQVNGAADLSMSKAVDNANAAIGSNVTFTLTVANAGPSDATNVVVTDQLPAGFTFVSSAGAGSYTAGTGVWQAGTIAAGASATRTIVATVNAAGPYVNNAQVTSVDQSDPDSTPGDGSGDDFASATVTPSVSADIAVVKTLTTPGPYVAGQTVSFNIVVSNNGPSPASNIGVADTPTGATLGAVSGACSALPCTIASLAAGASATITVAATLASDGNFSNAATATLPAGQTDPNPNNNTGTASGVAAPAADVAVQKTLTTGGVIVAGQSVQYQIVATNHGPSVATGFVLADTPSNIAITAVSGAGCTAFPCTLGSIAVNGTATVTVTATVGATGGAFNNSATATAPAGTTDPVPGNNTDDAPATAGARPINANPDTPPAVNGGSGGNTPSVVGNDTLGGQPVTVGAGGNSALTPGTRPNPGLTMNPDGTITVAPGTPAGTYTFPYTICEVANPTNCATTHATVTVDPSQLTANPDDYTGTPINGASGGNTPSVIGNDTINGQPVTVGGTGNVVLTPGTSPTPGLTMNPNGTIAVAPGTPAGSYTYPYTICERLNPSNCRTTTATVAVGAAPIVANPDDYTATPINGGSGGTTPPVIANDTLNGQPITVGAGGNAALTPGTRPNPGLSMNPDGTVAVAPGTPAGTYRYPYTVCEVLNPSNCATAIATVVVNAAPIAAAPDTATTPQNTPVTTPVLGNDTLNGAAIDPSKVTVTVPTAPAHGTVAVNPDGTIVYTPTPGYSGPDTYTYQVCETLNPSNCATATVAVTVQPNVVSANDDNASTPANTPLTIPVLGNDTVTGAPLNPASLTFPTPPAHGTVTLNPDGSVVYTPAPGYLGTDSFVYQVCDTSTPTPVCDTATVNLTVTGSPPVANPDNEDVATGHAGDPLVIDVLNNDTDPDNNIDPGSVLLTGAGGDGKTLVVAGEGTWTVNPNGTLTFLPMPGFIGEATPIQYTVADTTGLRSNPTTVRANILGSVRLRIVKTAQPRDVRIGDLVRYTLRIENVGDADAVDATVIDTPPPGFTYVSGSLSVADRDGAGRQTGNYPIRVDRIDIARGETATLAYLLRVGAGVRPGTHINRAVAQDNGATVSNTAQAEVRLIADPLLDESLILGTVFDDRDGDGWQDRATLDTVRVQGGFAPDAYVPGSTTIDRGDGPKPLADASAPLLHGIELGALAGRASDADPAPVVVIAQTLREPRFTGDFVLAGGDGVSLRMQADGRNQVQRSGRAGKGLDAAAPRVERRVVPVEGGVRVEYAIYNDGVDERGIPGVRIASVEGLLIETDPFGRYHLEGVPGGAWERGRNFILKVDPATLPPGTVLTTANPLLRRITPGLPVRFDFGAKLPPQEEPRTQAAPEPASGSEPKPPAQAQRPATPAASSLRDERDPSAPAVRSQERTP
ncbi:DUF11 domain-containing protein [Lysobacter sp. K5869]|uniref:Ig-like domain-containing protein n=1 Tax=Lysobacter sp. K5869 TaxID=2820808 RepID=UPI001C06275A|nr:Ig-like domain-containing protein [Lysobacter sp. K5869]QWP78720.1 DUF11 domain-containing protein [Lysobacter sp. K5869]